MFLSFGFLYADNYCIFQTVISPLTSLMQDQWKYLKSVGAAAKLKDKNESHQAKTKACSVTDGISHFQRFVATHK